MRKDLCPSKLSQVVDDFTPYLETASKEMNVLLATQTIKTMNVLYWLHVRQRSPRTLNGTCPFSVIRTHLEGVTHLDSNATNWTHRNSSVLLHII